MSELPTRVLRMAFLDDGSADREATLCHLRSLGGCTVVAANNADEAERLIVEPETDVIVSELGVWGWGDLDVIDRARAGRTSRPVILLTSRGDERLAVEALRRGAVDYISKRLAGSGERLQQSLAAIARQPHAIGGGSTWLDTRTPAEREQLFTQALDLISIVGYDGRPVHWNSVTAEALGYDSRQVSSLNMRDLQHPDDSEPNLAIRARVQAGESVRGYESRFRCADGSYKWLLWNSIPCVEQRVILTTPHDITLRKQFLQQLRESEERFRLAARATRDAVWDHDLRTDEIWRSEGFQTLFGYAPDRISPTFEWWKERVHPDDRQRILDQIPARGQFDTRLSTYEYRFRRADDTYADVVDRSFVMFSQDGQPLRMLGSLTDVTERRRSEELALMHRAELAHIARVSTMGEIATGLAHELNQPLTAIANYAESCARTLRNKSSTSQDKLLGWIDRIALNTYRAGEMIRRLRGFTRKTEPRRSTVTVQEIVAEVLDLIEAEMRMNNVRVRWEPSPRADVTVDRIQIQQVLINLLRNAAEAMSDNPQDERTVTISTRAQNQTAEVAIIDDGEGIAASDRDRVFDAFFTTKPNGMGIGLAIGRSIIEAHGGRLWVSSNAVRGATFHFTLPMSGA